MPPIVPPTLENIEQAAQALRTGQLVAFPTETVFGLGADATDPAAVAAIYAAKGRPAHNPLIVHVASWGMADNIGTIEGPIRALAQRVWPGPLTIVVPLKPTAAIARNALAGHRTVAIRWPRNETAQKLIKAVGRPIVAPSANRSGHVSATTAAHVAADLGTAVAVILDDIIDTFDTSDAMQVTASSIGPVVGVESTIVAQRDDGGLTLLRSGAVTCEKICELTGVSPQDRTTETAAAPTAPGQLESHYAPSAQVRLNVSKPEPGDAFLAFGPDAPATAWPTHNLSPSGDLHEAARELYAALRKLDATGVATIAVMPIPDHGIGRAINDRLRRAAAPRPGSKA